MLDGLIEILKAVQVDYSALDDVLWGQSTRSITSLLHNPSDDGSDKAVIDVTGDDELSVSVSVSDQQLKRLRRQSQAMLFWLSLRCYQLKLMIQYFKLNKADAMRNFYRKHRQWTRASLVITVCKKTRICSKTWGQWHNQFIINGGKFNHDERGLSQFGWLLVNEDKKQEFKNWLKCQKELDLQTVTDFVNETLLKEFPIGRTTNWGRLRRPVALSTVHHWMLQCDCSYDETGKSYMTDCHERHSTLLYRTWASDLDYFLSLRMQRWVCFPKSVVAKLKDQHDDWPDDDIGFEIPVADVGKLPPGANSNHTVPTFTNFYHTH